MTSPAARRLAVLGALGALASAAGCVPHYAIRPLPPSALKTEVAAPGAIDLSIVDRRAQRAFVAGQVDLALEEGGAPIDPPAFLARHLQEELVSRGLSARVSLGEGAATTRLDLLEFRVETLQPPKGPFTSLTFLKADLTVGAGPRRVAVYLQRTRFPLEGLEEIVDPALGQPLSLAVQELASKLARTLRWYRASDAAVDELLARVAAERGPDRYLAVYALGFSGNARATPALVQLTADQDEHVRLAAISSLGTLGAAEQLPLLQQIHRTARLWPDRAMALKAIGDLGAPEAVAFLAAQARALEGQGGEDAEALRRVLSLYL